MKRLVLRVLYVQQLPPRPSHWLACILWWLQCRGWLRWFLPYAGGRHIDWMPVRCDECGWMGPLRWCVHTYHGNCLGDCIEPRDDCPNCGSGELELEPS